jgi:hypothetical protein
VLPNLQLTDIWFWSHFAVLLMSDLDVKQTDVVVVGLSVTKIMFLTFAYLVTPKAGAYRELLFDNPASGCRNITDKSWVSFTDSRE